MQSSVGFLLCPCSLSFLLSCLFAPLPLTLRTYRCLTVYYKVPMVMHPAIISRMGSLGFCGPFVGPCGVSPVPLERSPTYFFWLFRIPSLSHVLVKLHCGCTFACSCLVDGL